jgi:hypothetical protein
MRFADQGVLPTGAPSGIGEKVAHAIGHDSAVVGEWRTRDEEGTRRALGVVAGENLARAERNRPGVASAKGAALFPPSRL